jgi:hypothetical protein
MIGVAQGIAEREMNDLLDLPEGTLHNVLSHYGFDWEPDNAQ